MNARILPTLAACLIATLFLRLETRAQYSGGYPGYSNTIYLPTAPASSMHYSSYLNFMLPIERAGHSFSLKWRATNGGSPNTMSGYVLGLATTSGVGPTAPLSHLALVASPPYGQNGPIVPYDWWLVDNTAQQETPASTSALSAGPLYNFVNAVWTATGGGVTNRYFAVPTARSGNGLLAGHPDPGTVWYMINTGPTIGTYTNGSSGTPVSLNWFVGSATSTGNGVDFYVADRSTAERTELNVTDVHLPNAWSVDSEYSIYPLIMAHVTLETREAGHHFTVRSWFQNVPPVQTAAIVTAGTGNSTLDFLVGTGLQFSITRDAENGTPNQPFAPPTGTTWIASPAQNPTMTFPASGRFPAPPLRSVVPHEFRVNADERPNHNFSVRMSDGYSTVFSNTAHTDAATGVSIPAYTPGRIDTWNDQGVLLPVNTYTFTAMVDPTRNITLRDDTTGTTPPGIVYLHLPRTDWLDPWFPIHTIPPTDPYITLQLPFTRMSDTFARPDVSQNALTIFSGPTLIDPLHIPGVEGMASWDVSAYAVTLLNPTPYLGGPFPIMDRGRTEPGLNVLAGVNDLRGWFLPEQAIDLQISSSRWGHALRVRHPNGESFPIAQQQLAAAAILLPDGMGQLVPFYYFDATSRLRSELPWYVEDTDTDERKGPNPTPEELIMWFALPDQRDLTAVQENARVVLRWNASNANPDGGFAIERRVGTTGAWIGHAGSYAGDLIDPATGRAEWREPLPNPLQTLQYRLYYSFGGERSTRTNEAPIDLYDSDEDGLPDSWELLHFPTVNAPQSSFNDDPDGDGVTNLAEYYNGTSPSDYYNGVLPELTIVAAPPSIGEIDQVMSQSFDVKVSGPGGTPIMANAPLTFSVSNLTSGGTPPLIRPSLSTPDGSSILFPITNANGVASVYLQLSSIPRVARIQATAFSGSLARSVSFDVRTIRFVPP